MTPHQLLKLGLAASLLASIGCHSCGDRPGLFGWRERARQRELAKERDRELDPTRPRLDDPIRPRDPFPVPELPRDRPPGEIPDRRYRVESDIGPSPGSWVGPTLELPRNANKIVLEPDPLPRGLNSPPAVLDIPRERPAVGYLEDPIPSKSAPKAESKPELNNPIPPVPNIERKAEKPPTLEEPIKPSFAASGTLPGLFTVPGFNDVYTGRKPTLDGFERLKSSGVRTVIYLHAPKADLSAPRNMAEKAGLTFEPIEVDASKLKDAQDRFTQSVKDSGKRPIFIFDESGSRAGVLWYLYFREAQLSDELARVRSGPLGLNFVTYSEDDQKLWHAALRLVK